MIQRAATKFGVRFPWDGSANRRRSRRQLSSYAPNTLRSSPGKSSTYTVARCCAGKIRQKLLPGSHAKAVFCIQIRCDLAGAVSENSARTTTISVAGIEPNWLDETSPSSIAVPHLRREPDYVRRGSGRAPPALSQLDGCGAGNTGGSRKRS